jgi:4-amino-4-deoxy-L-arabinose transferase-like glycosyltransferase
MKKIERWLALGLVLLLGFLLGTLGFLVWDKPPAAIERISWSAQTEWITAAEPSYRLYARRTFYVADPVQAGWLRLSADNDFILYVNGQAITRDTSAIQASQGLTSLLTDSSQTINDSARYRPLPPDWLQVSNPRDWKLTVYVDLTDYLRPGKNVIALALQKGQQNPRIAVEGAVYRVQHNDPIWLNTGATAWKIATLSFQHQGIPWYEPDFPDQSWAEAKRLGSVKEPTYSRLSPSLFSRSLAGNWITGTKSASGEVWLRGNWQVTKQRQRAFIRFAGHGEYTLLVNGSLINTFQNSDGNKLHMYEVTNLLQTGDNTLTVHLFPPLDQQASLRFFLDGWVESKNGAVLGAIATDSSWMSSDRPLKEWHSSSEGIQPALIEAPPYPQEFKRHYEGSADLSNFPDYLKRNGLWCLGGIGLSLFWSWSLGHLWSKQNGWWPRIMTGASLLLPGTLFLVGMGLLKHRYAELEKGLLFAHLESNPLILLGFVAVVLLTLLWKIIEQNHLATRKPIHSENLLQLGLWFIMGAILLSSLALLSKIAVLNLPMIVILSAAISIGMLATLSKRANWSIGSWFKAINQNFPNWQSWLLLAFIVSIGFGLRVYNLGDYGFESDEMTSLDAARGILRTGEPKAVSGIWYTRGPFYHYLLAGWLALVGDSATNAQLLSALWGTGILVLMFFFSRKVKGKTWVALIVVLLLVIDPIELWYSRFIRFYQVLQFMSITTFWLFIKGFIETRKRGYQYAFFAALTITVLTQELSITLVPCFLIGFLWYYKPFTLSKDWPLIVGASITLLIYAYNGLIVSLVTQTPLIALSESTQSHLKFHLSDITDFASIFFVGATRSYVIYTVFFFVGFAYSIKRKNNALIFLFCSVTLNLGILTVLVLQLANRYVQHTYPLLILLSVYGCVSVAESLGQKLANSFTQQLPLKSLVTISAVGLLLLNIEPDRVLASYRNVIIPQVTQVAEYVRTHRQPGDVVISNIPAAYSTITKLDYYLPHRIAPFDALYMHEGRLLDRWAGGVFVNNVDQMSKILEQAPRAWIHVGELKLSTNPKIAELQTYVEQVGQPIIEPFGSRLRLWVKEQGYIQQKPNQGRDMGHY